MLSTKSEVGLKVQVQTFNFQSDAKFDAKSNFFSMLLSPTVGPSEPEVAPARITLAQQRSLVRTPKRIKVRLCLEVFLT